MQPLPTRQSRVKKKSSIERIDPEAAEAVMGTSLSHSAGLGELSASPSAEAAASAQAAAPFAEEDAPEESIYEQMKATMRRQKEEVDAKNAALKQQRPAGYGRPGPTGIRPPQNSSGGNGNAPSPAVEKVTDFANLTAVWTAARTHLHASARYLESVLGHSSSIDALHATSGETLLNVPASQKGFANEKARAKIEETLRAVTGLPIRLALQFSEDEAPNAAEASRSGASHHSAAAQRIPPEVVDAIKAQPVVQQLMKRLDASIVNIEMLDTDDGA